MLSILIPTYNYNITRLVNDLHQQAMDAMVGFEMIVLEDGSTKFLEENKEIERLSSVKYEVLSENIGRSAIRNKLADKAQYNYLLFLDCDAEIRNQNFIRRYISCCADIVVVLGGRIYDDSVSPEYSLIWRYGTGRERNDLKNQHSRQKYTVFTSPNFLISKSVFSEVRFDESIKGYGHEDTIFGIELDNKGLKLTFVDNPVVHVGLEDNKTFVLKTENALRNLCHLYQSKKYPTLVKSSKILSSFVCIKKYRLHFVLSFFFQVFKRVLLKNLHGDNPSLFVFDCYKLGFLCKISCVR